MSSNGNKLELPANIVIRDLAQKIEKSPIDLIKKLMTNGVMATINQTVDFDTAAIVVGEYGFEAVLEAAEETIKEETGEVRGRWQIFKATPARSNDPRTCRSRQDQFIGCHPPDRSGFR